MMATSIAIRSVGLVTSVGLTAPETCAAFRAHISNPTETRFIDSRGEWIMAHQVQLDQPWRGLNKLAKMATMAIEEALQVVPRTQWATIPLLLCVAEAERPGRPTGLDGELFERIQKESGATFAETSAVVSQGRIGVTVALTHARKLITREACRRVLIAATDSLLNWTSLRHYDGQQRLLTARNSNGFMPGEAAGALLVEQATREADEFVCRGIGFGREAAHLTSDQPLRADGLAQAIKSAMGDAGCEMHEMHRRIADVSGEQYFFKEAALAVGRTLRQRKETFECWLPAESIGETGATAGVAMLSIAKSACRKGHGRGQKFVAHMANDDASRAASVWSWSGDHRGQ